MRTRVDDLTRALRSAREALGALPVRRSCDPLDEKLALALEAAEDVREGLGKMAFVSQSGAAVVPSQAIDIHEPLETALRMTRSIVGRRARLVRRYERVPAVRGDTTALTRVFAQLLQNAADAIPPYMPLANCISVRTYEDELGAAVVEISDTGVGIAASSIPLVFEPFFTTKSGAADGLGLTIARGEIVAAGGTIAVDSVEGRGARFTVRLPGVAGLSHTIERAFASELPHRRVMVVADTLSGGERLRTLFSDDRTVVVVAGSDEAVERLGMGETCDLVVIDADDESCSVVRERLAEVAPDVVMRTFEMCVRRSQSVGAGSGLWSIAAP
jgi:hypothetical protein